jgi:golgi pH regulator
VGILVFTQVRSFLLQLTRVFSANSSDLTSNVFILLLAEIMGVYFVSSVLLMRVNLPLEYRQIITDVLGDLEFDVFHAWFDAIFIIAAVITILWFSFQRKRSSCKLE